MMLSSFSGLVEHSCSHDWMFPCLYDKSCLPYLFVCDGKVQCKHASDENQPHCCKFTFLS